MRSALGAGAAEADVPEEIGDSCLAQPYSNAKTIHTPLKVMERNSRHLFFRHIVFLFKRVVGKHCNIAITLLTFL
jgi:hypothetical protein